MLEVKKKEKKKDIEATFKTASELNKHAEHPAFPKV